MFDILCSLPLTSELFAQSLSPSEPLLAVGLASGHVETFRLPTGDDDKNPSPSNDDDDDDDDDDSGNTATESHTRRRSSLSSHSSPTPAITSAWRTRRHKGSCRTLCYGAGDGAVLFSGGSDGLVKCADSGTGRVVAKIAVPSDEEEGRIRGRGGDIDAPSILHALTPTALLLGTDSGAVHLYDTRTAGSVTGTKKKAANGNAASSTPALLATRPATTWRPHLDFVSSICAVPASESSTSGLPRAFLSTGSGSVALTDIRKGVVSVSVEGNEPVVASALSSPSGRFVAGDAAGNLTSWDRSVAGKWGDGLGRARVDVQRAVFGPDGILLPAVGGQSSDVGGGEDDDAGIEVMCAVPEGSGAANELGGDAVVLGWDTGRVEVVALQGKGRGKSAGGKPATRGEVVADFPGDVEAEGVVGLGFDATGRLVVGAGSKVTIYAQTAQEEVDWQGEEGSDDEEEEEDDDDSDGQGEAMVVSRGSGGPAGAKRSATAGSNSGGSDEDDGSSSDEEQRQKKPKKKKRKGKAQKNHLSFNFAGLD